MVSSISMALVSIYIWIDSQSHSSNPEFSLDSKCCYIFLLGIPTGTLVEIYPKLSLLIFSLGLISSSISCLNYHSLPTYLVAAKFPPLNLSTIPPSEWNFKNANKIVTFLQNSFLTLSAQKIRSKFLDMTWKAFLTILLSTFTTLYFALSHTNYFHFSNKPHYVCPF